MIDDSEIDVKWWRKREARNKNVEEEGFVYNNKKKGKIDQIDWYEDLTLLGQDQVWIEREERKRLEGCHYPLIIEILEILRSYEHSIRKSPLMMPRMWWVEWVKEVGRHGVCAMYSTFYIWQGPQGKGGIVKGLGRGLLGRKRTQEWKF